MNHTEKELLVNRSNTTMDLTAGTATVAAAADRYGAHHRCKARTVIPAKARTVIPAKAGIQKMELIKKSNPERVDLYGELV